MDIKGWIFARRARGGPTAPAGRHEAGNAPTVTQFCVQGRVDAEKMPDVLTRTVTHERAHPLTDLTATIASVRVEYPGSGQAPFVRVVGYDRMQVRLMWASTALSTARRGETADPYRHLRLAAEQEPEESPTRPIPVVDLSPTVVSHSPMIEHEEP